MGPDNFHSKVLRDLIDIFERPLFIVLEKLWRSGSIPEDWQKANDSPAYKKSLKDDPGNYRPIILSSIPGKLGNKSLWGGCCKSDETHDWEEPR